MDLLDRWTAVFIFAMIDEPVRDVGFVVRPTELGSDSKGCSFRYAELDHADFRDAENILEADFTGAKGLETCFFDADVLAKIIESARSARSPQS
jgi:uncharacterized protein YjbI with pentapeptide repeats